MVFLLYTVKYNAGKGLLYTMLKSPSPPETPVTPASAPSTTIAAVPPSSSPPKVFTCGTLSYTKSSLFILFTWLLIGDFCFQMFELLGGPDILGLYLQDNFHVSNVVVNVMFSSIPMGIGTFMTPIISFRSDRYRSRLGRRIPFMLFTIPFLCFFAAAIGFSEDIIEFFKNHLNSQSVVSPLTAAMLMIGFMTIGFTVFNEFVGTVFYYLFPDVVPKQYLGRFMSLFRLVGSLAGFIIDLTLAEAKFKNLKAVHVGIAILYFVGFGLMCWRVREGEYPPVTDVTEKTSIKQQVKLFFKESFCHPIFIFMYCMAGATALNKGIHPSGIFGLHLNQHQCMAEVDTRRRPICAAASSDGRLLVSGDEDGRLCLWRHSTAKEVTSLASLTLPSSIQCVAMSSDGKLVLAGTSKGELAFVDVTTDSKVSSRMVQAHDGPVNAVALDSAGTRVVSAGEDGLVCVWDARVADARVQMLKGHKGSVRCVAFSAGGDRLVSGGMDRKIIVWNIARGSKESEISNKGPVYCVCFAPALEKAPTQPVAPLGWMTQKAGAIGEYLRDVFNNESLYDIPADKISRIVQDDKWIVGGGRDGDDEEKNSMLRTWDADSGKLVREFKGHKQAIRCVAYKPDLRIILSGSSDGTVRLWKPLDEGSMASDQCFKSFSGYTTGVTSLSCAASGSTLIDASNTGSLHVWDIDQGVSLRKGGVRGSFFRILAILLAFPFGLLVDKFHPIRILFWTSLLALPFTFLSFWWIQDYASGTWLEMMRTPFTGLAGAATAVFHMLLLPRTKYGQFCSANALVRQAVAMIAGGGGGLLMDRLTCSTLWTDNYRYGYLLQGCTATLSMLMLVGVYYHWKKQGGMNYVAPE
jgi:WD40 repeat protein